jgi:hypothetical protein
MPVLIARTLVILLTCLLAPQCASADAEESSPVPKTRTTTLAETREDSSKPDAADDSLQRKKLDYYRKRMRTHRLYWADDPKKSFDFVEDPLIRFDNPISKIDDGLLFAWTDQGRPVALAKSYYNAPQRTWGRTFVALGTRPLEMQIENRTVWTPSEAGVAFAPFPNAPEPAAQPQLRLAQMRALAERFQVIDHWGKQNPTEWTLRRLPAPLHRYAVADEQVVDAALFGYVLTTGPEAVVLLEARTTDDGKLQWYYAVSRLTVFAVTFSLDGREVAQFPRLETWPPTGTYFHIPQPLPAYPFDAEDK